MYTYKRQWSWTSQSICGTAKRFLLLFGCICEADNIHVYTVINIACSHTNRRGCEQAKLSLAPHYWLLLPTAIYQPGVFICEQDKPAYLSNSTIGCYCHLPARGFYLWTRQANPNSCTPLLRYIGCFCHLPTRFFLSVNNRRVFYLWTRQANLSLALHPPTEVAIAL